MKIKERDHDESGWRLEAANARLTRHERMTRIALLLIVVLNVMLLALVAFHLLGLEWTPRELNWNLLNSR